MPHCSAARCARPPVERDRRMISPGIWNSRSSLGITIRTAKRPVYQPAVSCQNWTALTIKPVRPQPPPPGPAARHTLDGARPAPQANRMVVTMVVVRSGAKIAASEAASEPAAASPSTVEAVNADQLSGSAGMTPLTRVAPSLMPVDRRQRRAVAHRQIVGARDQQAADDENACVYPSIDSQLHVRERSASHATARQITHANERRGPQAASAATWQSRAQRRERMSRMDHKARAAKPNRSVRYASRPNTPPASGGPERRPAHWLKPGEPGLSAPVLPAPAARSAAAPAAHRCRRRSRSMR